MRNNGAGSMRMLYKMNLLFIVLYICTTSPAHSVRIPHLYSCQHFIIIVTSIESNKILQQRKLFKDEGSNATAVNLVTPVDDMNKINIQFCTTNKCKKDGKTCYCCQIEKPVGLCYHTRDQCKAACPSCNPTCPPESSPETSE